MKDRAPLRRTAKLLALAALLVYAVSGGGRITGSDEVTMYDLSRALLRGGIAVPEGATLRGPDGRFYSKNNAGQAMLAAPFVAAGEAAAAVSGLPPQRAELASRFVASFFNAFVCALLVAALYAFARRLGATPGASFAAAVLLGFTTPLWVYAKSFMAEPLEALGLLLALGNAALASAGGAQPLPDERRRLIHAGLGGFLAVSAKASMLPLVLVAFAALGRERPSRWLVPLAGVALAAAGHLAYNVARFGNPLESGYGAQASAAAFTTPLLVGLYGLLLSSGKGVLWFAPAVWLAPAGVAEMTRSRSHSGEARHGGPARRAGRAAVAMWAVALLQFGTFQHWAGDGSWGPRYLVPLLPPALLAVAFALTAATRARRRAAWALGIAGLLVTLGGVGIHYGAEMREVGDYPYTTALDDPRFMEASHFNPRFSPIAVHWRMLADNITAHLHGDLPVLGSGGPVDPRLGISATDQHALLRAIDVWWLYARYAGLPGWPLALAAIVLAAAAAGAGAAALGALARERAHPV
ncbi:MAG: hypothetical protein IT347_13535 [Candidatus Eisenbacteria bacterium]|nr:hypothetical protein [Candidatus Eisenbacteria bacterium]